MVKQLPDDECIRFLPTSIMKENASRFFDSLFEHRRGNAMSADGTITKNFLGIDKKSIRTSNALKNRLNIECVSKDFNLFVEMAFHTKYANVESCGLLASQHFGRAQSIATKPMYCLFVANLLPARVVAHFFNLNRFKTAAYGGQTSIVPVELSVFREMLLKTRDENLQDSRYLQTFLQEMVEHGRNAEDENQWLDAIQQSAKNWCAA